MKTVGQSLALSAVALAAAFTFTPAPADAAGPVVVELFTSQGCSSCPPANVNLGELSRRSDVLALSFGVTYWDYLGWKDSFAKPSFTDRQVRYEPGLHHTGPFTPQMVVNGSADAVGNKLSQVEDLIASAKSRRGPDIQLSGNRVTIGMGDTPHAGADVWAVFFDQRTVNVPVARGENTGRTLPHTNVVRGLSRIGTWTGSTVTLSFPQVPAGLSGAVLLQVTDGGPILAAARQDKASQ